MTLLSRALGAPILHGVQRAVVRGRLHRAGLAERTVTVGAARVRLWEGGRGRPLLLLHGFGGDGGWTWNANVGALAPGRRLVVPDLLWFGGSTSADRGAFSLDHQADAMIGALDRLGVDGFDVAGISYGGFVAWTLARRWPDRVGRLVLVDCPGPAWSAADHAAALVRLGVRDLADVVLPDGPDGVRRLIDLAWYRPPPTPRFVLGAVHQRMFTARVAEQRELLRWLDQHGDEIRGAPWQVSQPTLLVWGAHDPLFPVGVAERLRDALPDARLEVLPRARHAPNLEQAPRFAAAVTTFLDAPADAARAAG